MDNSSAFDPVLLIYLGLGIGLVIGFLIGRRFQ